MVEYGNGGGRGSQRAVPPSAYQPWEPAPWPSEAPGHDDSEQADHWSSPYGQGRVRRRTDGSAGRRGREAGLSEADLDEPGPRRRSQGSPAKRGRAKAPSRRRRVAKWTVLSVVAVLLLVVGAGAYVVMHLTGNIKSSALLPKGGTQAPEIPNQFGQTAMNILLLGNAGRISAADCKLAGACTDTATSADSMMVLHLAADRSNMTVMSIPRDSIVDLPACAHDPQDLINASLVYGASCSVQAVHDLTGLTIDHFIEIDMAGVVTMSNALGGVPVCVTNNVYDDYSHLKLPKGTSVIEGTEALAWLRTRHAFINEVYREQAQHMFLAALLRKVKANASLTDVTTLYSVADAATKALTVDNALDSVTSLLSLAQEIEKVPTSRVTFVSVPTIGYAGPNHAWSEQLQFMQPQAQEMFTALKTDSAYTPSDKGAASAPTAPGTASTAPAGPSPTSVSAAGVRVAVKNASGIHLRAAQVAGALEDAGFSSSLITTGNLPDTDATTLFYPATRAADAAAVAGVLGIPSTATKQSGAYSEVTLVIGTNWGSGTSYPGITPKGGGSQSAPPPQAPVSSPPADSLETNAADAGQCMYVPKPEW